MKPGIAEGSQEKSVNISKGGKDWTRRNVSYYFVRFWKGGLLNIPQGGE